MAEEKEILSYELNISDVEAKAKRIAELTQEITAEKGKGQNVTALEEQLGREVDALGKLTQQQKSAAGGAVELLQQKRNLASVVGLLGGEFGGLVSRLGNVVEMLLQGGAAAAGMAGAVAGVTVLVGAYRAMEEAVRAAREEQERLNQAVLEGKLGQLPTMERMGVELEKVGLRTPEGEKAAWQMMTRVMGHGIDRERAAGIAPLAVAAGLSPEQAGVVAVLKGMGLAVEEPGKLQEVLRQMQTGTTPISIAGLPAEQAGILAVLQAMGLKPGTAGTPAYQQAAAQLAAMPGTAGGRINQLLGELLRGQEPGFSAVETLYAGLAKTGKLPAGIQNVDQFRDKLAAASETQAELPGVREEIAELMRRRPGPLRGLRLARLERRKEDMDALIRDWGPILGALRREEAREAGQLPGPSPGSPTTQPAEIGADPARARIIIQEINNYGTVYNASSRARSPTTNHGRYSLRPGFNGVVLGY